jgi:hypothetical protein
MLLLLWLACTAEAPDPTDTDPGSDTPTDALPDPTVFPTFPAPPFQLTSTLAGAQHHATFAFAGDGRWLAAYNLENGVDVVAGRAFRVEGAPLGVDTLMSDPTIRSGHPQVAGAARSWLVCWQEYETGRIRMSQYRSDNGEFVDNVVLWEPVAGLAEYPDVAISKSAVMMAVWHQDGTVAGSGYVGRTYVNGLRNEGPSFVLPVQASMAQGGPPNVTAAPTTGFLVAWSERLGTASKVWVTRFSDDARNQIEPIDIATGTIGLSRPVMATRDDGRWAIGWRDHTVTYEPLGAWIQVFDEADAPVAAPFRLDSPEAPGDRPEVVGVGEHVIAVWESPDGDDMGIWMRTFSFDTGLPTSDAVLVNVDTEGEQRRPYVDVHVDEDGALVGLVTWESLTSPARASASVDARFFALAPEAP